MRGFPKVGILILVVMEVGRRVDVHQVLVRVLVDVVGCMLIIIHSVIHRHVQLLNGLFHEIHEHLALLIVAEVQAQHSFLLVPPLIEAVRHSILEFLEEIRV